MGSRCREDRHPGKIGSRLRAACVIDALVRSGTLAATQHLHVLSDDVGRVAIDAVLGETDCATALDVGLCAFTDEAE